MASSHTIPMLVMGIIGAMQVTVMGLTPANRHFWGHTERPAGMVLSVFSIVLHVIPVGLDDDTVLIGGLIVLIVLLVALICIVIFFGIFCQSSQLPAVAANVICFVFNGCLPAVAYFSSTRAGWGLALLVAGGHSISLCVVNLVLGAALGGSIPFFIRYFVNSQLTMRTQALQTMTGFHCALMSGSFCLICFLGTFGSVCRGITGAVAVYLCALTFLVPVLIFFITPYAFVSLSAQAPMISFYVTGFLLTAIYQTLDLLDIHANEVCLLAVFVLVPTGVVIMTFRTKRIMAEIQAECELCANDLDHVEALSYRRAVFVARCSFEMGYASAHKWHLFDRLFTRYGRDPTLCIIFTRYAALYPCETMTLHLAARRLEVVKRGNLDVKRLLFDVSSLLQQREAELSQGIKRSLTIVGKKVEKVRGQIRHFWEGIVRGNLDELEGLAVSLDAAQSAINHEYTQLCMVYPNNSFIAKAYSRFLASVENNDYLADPMTAEAKALRLGEFSRMERCYYFAHKLCPLLPTEDSHVSIIGVALKDQRRIVMGEGSTAFRTEVALDPELNEQQVEQRLVRGYVSGMIDHVRMPSMRYGPVIIVGLVICVMVACVVPLLVSVRQAVSDIRGELSFVHDAGSIELAFTSLVLIMFHHAISESVIAYHDQMLVDINPNLTLAGRWLEVFHYDLDRFPLPANGSTDKEFLIGATEIAQRRLTSIGTYSASMNDDRFANALELLYGRSRQIMIPVGFTWIPVTASFEDLATLILEAAAKGVTAPPDLVLIREELWIVLNNLVAFLKWCDELQLIILGS
jgi:type III secretory pathway component EscS